MQPYNEIPMSLIWPTPGWQLAAQAFAQPFMAGGRSAWLVIAAFIAGGMNALAGGGSLLLFPAMLATGMLPVHANATNTVALWPGQFTSIAAYREGVLKHLRIAIPMGIAGVAGGTLGALLLLRTPQDIFLHMVPWLLLTAAVIFTLSGRITRWLERRRLRLNSEQRTTPAQDDFRGPSGMPLLLSTALLCIYVGYFGAGGGILTIALLSLFGMTDMNEINALKVVTTTAANSAAFLIFVIGRQVEWRYCLLAMVTCAIGGYSAARFARKIPQPMLRGLVIAIGFTAAAWFFYKIR
jgi:uncharacterized protein